MARPDPADRIPPALRSYATIVTWLFVIGVAALIVLILVVIFT
jgi:hypothetical protein